MRWSYLVILLLPMSLGCAEEKRQPPVDPALPPMVKIAPAPAADVKSVVEGGNDLAFDLYGRLRTGKGNLFFSPYSISTALGMTYEGARGKTAAEMAQTLHFTLERDKLQPAFGTLLRQTTGDGKKYELRVANALWGAKGYPFAKSFLDTTRKYYGAGLEDVNFAEPKQAAKRINGWTAEQTSQRITEIVSPEKLSADTRLVLTNAIYFKGKWAEQFRKENTREQPFFVTASEKKPVPLMAQTHGFKYFEDKELKVLEMPYQGGDLSMVVVLPRKMDGLTDLEPQLTRASFDAWRSKARVRDVRVWLPRFKTNTFYNLGQTLADMGMPLAFSDAADFSGLNDGQEGLRLSFVLHSAFVEVNEEGTEAAAVTAVGVEPTAAAIPQEPMTFRADHPFVFAIVDNRTGSILFLGRYVEPK